MQSKGLAPEQCMHVGSISSGEPLATGTMTAYNLLAVICLLMGFSIVQGEDILFDTKGDLILLITCIYIIIWIYCLHRYQ